MASKFVTGKGLNSSPALALQEVSSTDALPPGQGTQTPQQPKALQPTIERFVEECRRANAIVDSPQTPLVDIGENDEVFIFTVDLPGMDEKDVDIRISRDILTIRGRRPAAGQEIRSWHLRERSQAVVERVVLMPEGVDTEDAALRFRNGVLTVRISKMGTQRKGGRRVVLAS